MHLLLRPISFLGAAVLGLCEFVGGLGYLMFDTAVATRRALLGKRGRRMGWENLWAQMVRVGVRSVPIVMLVLFCIGSILALQMAPILKDYGAVSRVADIISIAVFRELGPLVSAIVLTGFAGASIAAEIGTMVVSEEIEALEAQAISPIRFLVVPRVIATTIMMVCVAVVGDLVGVLGGLFVGRTLLGLDSWQYLARTFDAIHVRDFVTGLIKAGVFGALISSLACYLGLGVTGGAQGVGVATTRTVVLTIVALITVDLLFTTAFYAVGSLMPDAARAIPASLGTAAGHAVAGAADGMPAGDIAIQVHDVTKIYGSRKILDAIRLDVHKGETLVILGGSGSGKSTLLRLMIGNVMPNGGDVIGLGKSLCNMTEAELVQYRKSIGVLFQSGALFNSMTVAENVALPLREHTDLPEETIEIIVKIKLEQVGLREHAEKMPSELSGGMKKRAGLARAMSLDPKVLFYDEPSAGLDPVTSAEIDQLIIDLNKKLGITSVVVTHEMDSAFRIADRMVLLDRGKFIVSGTPDEMKNSTDPLVRQFVHGLTEGPLTDRRRAGGYEDDLLGA